MFTFNGSATGLDFADFLLGLPNSAAIAFGNADKGFRPSSYAYVNDDFRINPTVTINFGLRWDFESPFTEALGRLVNLDVADDSRRRRRSSPPRLQPDRRGLQPRLGLALRPIPASSVVLRAGYGIYRNTSVYQTLAQMCAAAAALVRFQRREHAHDAADARQRLHRAGRTR